MATREDSEGGRATRNHLLCGCVTSCLGDSEHEPRITYCATHAAAPELLAALQSIAQEIERGDVIAVKGPGPGFFTKSHDAETTAHLLGELRAAIRKATEGA